MYRSRACSFVIALQSASIPAVISESHRGNPRLGIPALGHPTVTFYLLSAYEAH